MKNKKRVTIFIDEQSQKLLKIMSATENITMGTVIEQLIKGQRKANTLPEASI